MSGQLAQAAAALDKAIADVKTAQASGDFVRYGQALQALDAAMTTFQNAQKAAGATASPSTPASTPPSGAPSAPAPTPSG